MEGTVQRTVTIAHTLTKNKMLENVSQVSAFDGNKDLKVAKTFQPLFQHFLIFIADGWRRHRNATFYFFSGRQHRKIMV
jgi:hypothetical protein